MKLPILFSFRRCPYAIRARVALRVAEQPVELREVVLRDKPPEFLTASPTATVPCMVTDGKSIDESLDIMIWALKRSDPRGWLDMPQVGWELIERADGPFKDALDRTKYATRYPEIDASDQRAIAAEFLTDLDQQITEWIFGKPTVVDYAILPFVRQFAFIDKDWFDSQPWPNLQPWLERFLASTDFTAVMDNYPQWPAGQPPIPFP